MAELKNHQWLLAARPSGMIKESDFRWNESTVPALKDGQVLVRNLAFSFDPTQRGWMSMDTYIPAIPVGEVMKAGTIGQIVESRREGFAKGDLLQGLFGWEDYTVNGGEGLMGLQKLPAGTDPILALSLFGTTGLTAYFGTLAVGQVKAGDTFVVSGAGGATGSVSGMIAKIKGCHVVGIAGGREHARVVLCGAISQYNEMGTKAPTGPKNYFSLILHGARMEGFLVFHFLQQYPDAIAEMRKWYAEGKLKNQVDLQHGLENAPKTIIRLFTGANFGKQLLKLADPQ